MSVNMKTMTRVTGLKNVAVIGLYVPSCMIAALMGLCLISCGQKDTHPGPAKQVIIFDIDTLRADHLGCYGYDRPTSPHIDRLASEGVLFEWAFAQGPNTPPSQTSILTSLYPSRHGRLSALDVLAEEVTTLAEVMVGGGFVTAAFVDGGNMAAASGLDQGFQTYRAQPAGGFDVIGPRVIRWLQRHARQDFFLLIHTYDVHSPYDPPEPYGTMFVGDARPSTQGFEPTTDMLADVMVRARRGERDILSRKDIEYTIARYDGGVRFVDDWIGRFLAELDRLDIFDGATIVFLSDHGEEFQEHGSVLHEKLYTTVARIPLIIRSPGGRKALRVSQIVESIDVMPTILEMVGLDLPSTPIQGESLVPLMSGDAEGPFVAFSESRFFGGRDAIAIGDAHLLRSRKTGLFELYRFTSDPMEQLDVHSENHDETLRLLQRLDSYRGSDQRPAAQDKILDPETINELKALGYLQDE